MSPAFPDEPADHAVGRSRGGLTIKILALTDIPCAPVTVLLTAGQIGDNPQLWPLLGQQHPKEQIAAAGRHSGSPGGCVDDPDAEVQDEQDDAGRAWVRAGAVEWGRSWYRCAISTVLFRVVGGALR